MNNSKSKNNNFKNNSKSTNSFRNIVIGILLIYALIISVLYYLKQKPKQCSNKEVLDDLKNVIADSQLIHDAMKYNRQKYSTTIRSLHRLQGGLKTTVEGTYSLIAADIASQRSIQNPNPSHAKSNDAYAHPIKMTFEEIPLQNDEKLIKDNVTNHSSFYKIENIKVKYDL